MLLPQQLAILVSLANSSIFWTSRSGEEIAEEMQYSTKKRNIGEPPFQKQLAQRTDAPSTARKKETTCASKIFPHVKFRHKKTINASTHMNWKIFAEGQYEEALANETLSKR